MNSASDLLALTDANMTATENPAKLSPRYAALRVRSEYSLIDSTIRLEQLIKQAKVFGLPAIALTDELNLFALVKFFKEAESAGIKPIVGADCRLKVGTARYRFTLLCQDQQGYLNLCRLISRAHIERNKSEDAGIRWEWLREHNAGLIALVGFESDVADALSAGNLELARSRGEAWKTLFADRLYFELSRCGRAGENRLVPAFAELSLQLDLPCVATSESVYLQSEEALNGGGEAVNTSPVENNGLDDFAAHEARVCIHEGFVLADASRVKRHSRLQFLPSPEQMQQRFNDVPQALENSLELAKRCNVSLKLGTYYLPNFPTPPELNTAEFLAQEAHQGLRQRLDKLSKLGDLAVSEEDYRARLDLELSVIARMGFPGYFLIVSEFIRWAKAQDIPVGPGRGSGAGSLVAYALSITDLDPIRYDLLFERFLNPERVSMPDFDVDFCMDRRDEVIQHVSDLYGAEKVSQIITYGTMAAKACIRDAGRVLGMSYGHTDSIAKLIPNVLGIELQQALEQSSELRAALERDEDARNLIQLALKLEGLTRNAGKHAGGVVIAPSALTDFSPLYSEGTDPDSVGELPVTQFDKDDVEAIGLVKFDFLGLRTLTILDWALKAINADRRDAADPLDLSEVRLDDKRTFDLLQSGRTTAVFQLESRGMKELAKKLQPSTFEDIIALGALFRPGPLQSGMVDEFVERKHGRRSVEYAHPSLEPVLKPTYGVIVYQEQVMQIAQVLAGYTLGGADMLRRAMGKKNAEAMAKQRAIFGEGAALNGVAAERATSIFDLMEKFAEYGFNKSHSAAYAMVTYHTAYLKAYYPAEFMAAVLSSEADNTDKIQDFLADARAFDVRILPPDVQHSQVKFAAQEAPMTIRYGLSAIKGAGAHVCQEIVESRRRDGKFLSLSDFVTRLNAARPNRRVLEALIDSGALDSLAPHRAVLHAELGDALKLADKTARDHEAGQFDMFAAAAPPKKLKAVISQDFTLLERLQREKAVLGGYFSGHPLDQHKPELQSLGCLRLDEQAAKPGPKEGRRTQAVPAVVAGEIEMIRRKEGVAFTKLSDGSGGTLEVGFFKDVLDRSFSLLKEGEFVLIAGGLSWDAFNASWQVKARQAYTLDQAFALAARKIKLTCSGAGTSFVNKLKQVLAAHAMANQTKHSHTATSGSETVAAARIQIEVQFDVGSLVLELGPHYRALASTQIKALFEAVGGISRVELEFDASRLQESGESNFDRYAQEREPGFARTG